MRAGDQHRAAATQRVLGCHPERAWTARDLT
jgi:hypothetical protein